MNYSNVFAHNKRQFNSTMNRECITVTDYFDTSKTYDVFFRRNNRGTSPQGKLRFYYAQDTPIAIGTIFTLKGIPYIVTSQDGIESDIYYTSLAVLCDTTFNIYSNTEGKYITMPFSVISDKYTVSNGNVFSMVTGSVTVFTKDNSYAREIAINNEYYNFGGYYKVGNVFYNNGLAYIYMTRELLPNTDQYVFTFDGTVNIDKSVTSTYQLSYTTMKNNVTVDNPALTYSTSDSTVATVNETGLMTILSTGSVTITATWTDGDNINTCATNFAITGTGAAYTTEITASTDTVKVGGSYKTLTLKFYDIDGTDITDTTITDLAFEDFVWTCSCDGVDLTNNTDVITWYHTSSNAVNINKIKFADDRSYLEKTLVVTCVVNCVTASKSFEITAV